MTGFAWMYEKGRGAGTGKRGRDFAADVARLAHASDNNSARRIQAKAAGLQERVVKSRAQAVDSSSFNVQHIAG